MQAGLIKENADAGPGLTAAKYRAMCAALGAISKAPAGAVRRTELLALMIGELRKATPAVDDAAALAIELLDTLVKDDISTKNLLGHRFSSRGAHWYFGEVHCAPAPC